MTRDLMSPVQEGLRTPHNVCSIWKAPEVTRLLVQSSVLPMVDANTTSENEMSQLRGNLQCWKSHKRVVAQTL